MNKETLKIEKQGELEPLKDIIGNWDWKSGMKMIASPGDGFTKGEKIFSTNVSPDGETIVYRVMKNGRVSLVTEKGGVRNEMVGAQFDMRWPEFSMDGSKIAVISMEDENSMGLYINGQKQKIDAKYLHDVALSPDGKHFAVEARQKIGQSTIIVDGKPIGKLFDECNSIIFSPDNSHIFFNGVKGKNVKSYKDKGEPVEEYPTQYLGNYKNIKTEELKEIIKQRQNEKIINFGVVIRT